MDGPAKLRLTIAVTKVAIAIPPNNHRRARTSANNQVMNKGNVARTADENVTSASRCVYQMAANAIAIKSPPVNRRTFSPRCSFQKQAMRSPASSATAGKTGRM